LTGGEWSVVAGSRGEASLVEAGGAGVLLHQPARHDELGVAGGAAEVGEAALGAPPLLPDPSQVTRPPILFWQSHPPLLPGYHPLLPGQAASPGRRASGQRTGPLVGFDRSEPSALTDPTQEESSRDRSEPSHDACFDRSEPRREPGGDAHPPPAPAAHYVPVTTPLAPTEAPSALPLEMQSRVGRPESSCDHSGTTPLAPTDPPREGASSEIRSPPSRPTRGGYSPEDAHRASPPSQSRLATESNSEPIAFATESYSQRTAPNQSRTNRGPNQSREYDSVILGLESTFRTGVIP